ncbi:MAG: hypothetical protein NVS3B5_05390 [Sphingomicrobium sp.]
MMLHKFILMLGLATAAAPTIAAERDFCAERPGQTTPPCTLAPGDFMIETGLVDWSRAEDAGSRTDTYLLGNSLLRGGVTPRLEFQLGWTPYGTVYSRDLGTGMTQTGSSVGDVTLGALYGIGKDNGPVAIQGFVTLPTGGSAIGAGDWGAGARLPVQLPVGHGMQLSITPEMDAAVNSSGKGRHLVVGSAAGIGGSIAARLSASVDAALFRSDEPSGARTLATAAASIAYQAGKRLQFDTGIVAGLNRDTPKIRLYAGVAARF